MNRTITTFLSLLTLIIVMNIGMTLEACPNCKDAYSKNQTNSQADLKQMAERERTGKAYNLSVMLMMPLPFLIALGLGGMLYYHSKKVPSELLTPPSQSGNSDE